MTSENITFFTALLNLITALIYLALLLFPRRNEKSSITNIINPVYINNVQPCYTFLMRFPEYSPPNLPKNERFDSVAHEAREQAIQKLQKDLAENKTSSQKVRKARLEALIKLLENSERAKHGELATGEMMHYSEPAEPSANESHIGEIERAA